MTSGILEDEDLELQLTRLERETVKKSENSGRRNVRRVTRIRKVSRSSSMRTDSSTETEDFVEEAAAVRKAEEDWSMLCKFIEKMELTNKEAPTEEVRKSEEFDRRNIRRVTRVIKEP